MNIRYSIEIVGLDAENINGFDKAVRRVVWKYKAVDLDTGLSKEIESIEAFNLETFQIPDPASDTDSDTLTVGSSLDSDNFTPFESLTENDILNWIRSIHGRDGMELFRDGVTRQLKELIAMQNSDTSRLVPEAESMSLPWRNG